MGAAGPHCGYRAFRVAIGSAKTERSAGEGGLGADDRASGAASRGEFGDRVAAVALAVCFVAYLWRYLPVVPGSGPTIADDYGLHFPNLLAGYFHFLANGPFSVPWFSPAECGGVPFLADLNVAYYSLPQVLTLFIDPASAISLTFVVFAALGAIGFYLLLRSRFGLSPWAAATAAVLFLFNGFFVVRMAVGHLTFHPFMLAPWIAWAALLPAPPDRTWTWRRLVLATVLVGAIFAYQFEAGMQHIIVPVALAAAIIVLVQGHLRGHAWQPWAILALGALLSVGLSAQRFAAAIAFADMFPRTLYPLPGFLSVLNVIKIAGLSLFWRPPGDIASTTLVNHIVILDWPEWAYGVGPAALVLLVAGAAAVLVRWLVAGAWRRPIGGLMLVAAIALVMAIPIALNVYTPGWNAFLKGLPVLGQSVTLARWFVLFIPPAVLGAALAVDRLTPSRLWAGGIFLVVAIATVWWNGAQPIAVERNYNGTSIARAWHEARAAGVPPITKIAGPLHTDAVQSFTDRNNAMVDGMSEIQCYQPMFGYRLEVFPAATLQVGSILSSTAGGGLNLANPSCYLFSLENRCLPGAPFREDQKAALLDFAAYRAFPFARSAIQTAADWTNLIALIGAALAVLAALVRRRRRTGTDATPTV